MNYDRELYGTVEAVQVQKVPEPTEMPVGDDATFNPLEFFSESPDWLRSIMNDKLMWVTRATHDGQPRFYLQSPSGKLFAGYGDYIVKDEGGMRVVPRDQFDAQYKPQQPVGKDAPHLRPDAIDLDEVTLRHLPGHDLPWQWHALKPHIDDGGYGLSEIQSTYLAGFRDERAAKVYGSRHDWCLPPAR